MSILDFIAAHRLVTLLVVWLLGGFVLAVIGKLMYYSL